MEQYLISFYSGFIFSLIASLFPWNIDVYKIKTRLLIATTFVLIFWFLCYLPKLLGYDLATDVTSMTSNICVVVGIWSTFLFDLYYRREHFNTAFLVRAGMSSLFVLTILIKFLGN